MSNADVSFREDFAKNPNGSTRVAVSYRRTGDGLESVEITVFATPQRLGCHLNETHARELALDLAQLSTEVLLAIEEVGRMRRLAGKALAAMEAMP